MCPIRELILVSHKIPSVLLIYSSPVKVLSVIEERKDQPSKHQKTQTGSWNNQGGIIIDTLSSACDKYKCITYI
jgi:hypothetical protein